MRNGKSPVICEPLEPRQLMTVLTFERDPALSFTTLQRNDVNDYGDRVSAAVQGLFSYGTEGGATPNIAADFTPRHATGGYAMYNGGISAYGDLRNVLYSEDDTGKKIVFRLVADANYSAALRGFDLGGYSFSDHRIKQVKIEADGVTAFSEGNVLVQGDNVGPRHTTFNFATPIGGREIKVTIDCSNMTSPAYPSWIGLDNVRFSQQWLQPAFELSNGVLKVTGTTGSDTISLKRDGATVVARRGGLSQTFAAGAVISIDVNAGHGNDNVSMGAGLPGARISGGNGNDVLSGGTANDRLLGGAGSDVLIGNGGSDSLDGGDGDDLLIATSDNAIDKLVGGNGFDIVHAEETDMKTLVEVILA